MKQITLELIDSVRPCYPALKYYDEKYKGNILQIAQDTRVPFEDRLWFILRAEFVSDKFMRLFAVWCVRRVVNKKAKSDVRSINALKVAARFARGKATKKELNAASKVALKAYFTADSGTHAAYAAYRTTCPLVQDAAICAAFKAALQESLSANKCYLAARKAQEIQLIKMIKAGIKTKDVK